MLFHCLQRTEKVKIIRKRMMTMKNHPKTIRIPSKR